MIETYPTDRLYEEVAFIAYHFNWSREEVMGLTHEERQRWCEEISAINDRMNQEGMGDDDGGMTLTQEIDFGESDTQDLDFGESDTHGTDFGESDTHGTDFGDTE